MANKKSRTARIRSRIAETTAVAKEKFIPIEDGPDPRLHRHDSSLISVKEAAGGAFDESFDYENPDSERFLPEGMDGVIQIKTRGEIAADTAYEMVLKDPASVLAPRQFYDESGGPKRRTIVDAGHELAKKQISEHHDPARVDRVREGLGISAEGEEPALPEVLLKDVPPEIEEAIAREMQSPHKAALVCAGCGGGLLDLRDIGKDGEAYCADCRNKGLDDLGG